jgi:hypothetical protein
MNADVKSAEGFEVNEVLDPDRRRRERTVSVRSE